jgi:F420-dependent oxidoreductase-like protein
MKIGMPMPYARDFTASVDRLREFESVGLDAVLLPEAYGFDAVSQLGYIAAKSDRLRLCSSILGIYSRTPALLAMTAAGLDYVSNGRFILGIGASGPQVVEGFHGVRYDAPLARTREIVEICRTVWKRQRLDHDGRYYHAPLTRQHGGGGLGKPLKLIDTPVRDRIPMVLAALGPKNVALAAELFEGWAPLFYLPERAAEVFGECLAAGAARRSPQLRPLEIWVSMKVLITEDEAAASAGMQQVREHLALYFGGMGARGRNFYNDLIVQYGYEAAAAKVQDLYLSGRKAEAAATLPDDLVRGLALVGPAGWVAERVAAFAASGVTMLNAAPIAPSHEQRLEDIARLSAYAG